MGFGSKCSILNGKVIYIEKSKLNIADMWLIPLDHVTFWFSYVEPIYIRDGSQTLVRGAWCKKNGTLKFYEVLRGGGGAWKIFAIKLFCIRPPYKCLWKVPTSLISSVTYIFCPRRENTQQDYYGWRGGALLHSYCTGTYTEVTVLLLWGSSAVTMKYPHS